MKGRRQELRKESTSSEKDLWPFLRSLRKFGFVFRRQHSIGNYVADFYCPKTRLVTEVDGSIHDKINQQLFDKERDAFMKAQEYQVLRVKNQEITEDFASVSLKILRLLNL